MLNNTILFILAVSVIFVVATIFILRKIRSTRIRQIEPTINHEYVQGETYLAYTETGSIEEVKREHDHELITHVCHFCNQVDHIHINSDYIERLIRYNHKNIGMAEYMVRHNDHRIIHYINADNEYVSSKIPPNDLRDLEYRLTDELTINGVVSP